MQEFLLRIRRSVLEEAVVEFDIVGKCCCSLSASTPVLYRLHWLPVSFRIEYKVLILTYKAIHGHAPPYISDLIRTRERINYNLRSSSQLLLQPYNVTKTKKTLGDRAFQVVSPGLWNGLPNDIRNAKTMDVFKSLVKTHLFRKAYACYF